MDHKLKDWNTHVTILPFCSRNEYPPEFNFTSSDSYKEMEKYVFYQSQRSIDKQAKKGMHLSLVLGTNEIQGGGMFILNCRWLRYKNIELTMKDQNYLWSKIGNKLDMKRKGGSNSNSTNFDLLKFFEAIGRAGKSYFFLTDSNVS